MKIIELLLFAAFYSHQTPEQCPPPPNTPHLVRIIIQNLVLDGREGGPTGGEGGAVNGPGGAGGAARVPPRAYARLDPPEILLSPVESHRPPPAAAALSSQEEDVEDHERPDHIR